MRLLMIHKACMPVYKWSRKLLRTGRVGNSKVLQEVLADLKKWVMKTIAVKQYQYWSVFHCILDKIWSKNQRNIKVTKICENKQNISESPPGLCSTSCSTQPAWTFSQQPSGRAGPSQVDKLPQIVFSLASLFVLCPLSFSFSLSGLVKVTPIFKRDSCLV